MRISGTSWQVCPCPWNTRSLSSWLMRLQHAPTRARKAALLTGGAGRRCGVRATASSTLIPTTFSTHGLKLGKTKPLKGYREPASAILPSAFTCPLVLSAPLPPALRYLPAARTPLCAGAHRRRSTRWPRRNEKQQCRAEEEQSGLVHIVDKLEVIILDKLEIIILGGTSAGSLCKRETGAPNSPVACAHALLMQHLKLCVVVAPPVGAELLEPLRRLFIGRWLPCGRYSAVWRCPAEIGQVTQGSGHWPSRFVVQCSACTHGNASASTESTGRERLTCGTPGRQCVAQRPPASPPWLRFAQHRRAATLLVLLLGHLLRRLFEIVSFRFDPRRCGAITARLKGHASGAVHMLGGGLCAMRAAEPRLAADAGGLERRRRERLGWRGVHPALHPERERARSSVPWDVRRMPRRRVRAVRAPELRVGEHDARPSRRGHARRPLPVPVLGCAMV